MRKIIFIIGLWLGLAGWAEAAEVNLSLTDGSTVQGELLKFDDNGVQLRVAETYTNLPWARFSQETLKQLGGSNPKIKPLVEPFIEPEISQRPPKPEIKIKPVTRLQRPENPSLFGGLLKSSVGKFIFFVLFLANLYAAFEIAIVKARPAAQVMGVSALLPIIGPIIFLVLPMQTATAQDEHIHLPAPAGTQGAASAAAAANPEIQIGEASWKQEEKKAEPQIFARGKFTFNKRFIETKFAGFVGVPAGEAMKFDMELKTGGGQFAVERIAQVGTAEAIFETTNGQVTVPFADILEIKLNPKPA